MPPYDDRLFVPPAPVLTARLRNPEDGTTIPDVRLLIDTGADVTLLPLAAVNAAGIAQTEPSQCTRSVATTTSFPFCPMPELF